MRILATISFGELIDKITILELKQELIKDPQKQTNINYELSELNKILSNLLIKTPLNTERETLKAVNRELWHIENFKRECELNNNFDHKFIQAARNVYLKNDLRAQIKKEINTKIGSTIIEEKYHPTT